MKLISVIMSDSITVQYAPDFRKKDWFQQLTANKLQTCKRINKDFIEKKGFAEISAQIN